MIQLLSLLLWLSPAQAWEHHQVLMERLLDSSSVKLRLYAFQKIKLPCIEDEKKEIEKVAQELDLDASKIPIFSKTHCASGAKEDEMLMSDLLTGTMIDEPDQGMDRERPASSDPKNIRKWMGGATGPTSQGFRHMYFAGFEWGKAIDTIQLPFRAVGDALTRIETLRRKSDWYFSEKNFFWGVRTLLWELHYLQDLQQPFHVTQSPSIKMVPWKKIFSGLIKAATHSLGNFHYAYEGLVLEQANDSSNVEFQKCFEPEKVKAYEEASELIELPRKLSPELGDAVYRLFGSVLMSPDVDLPAGVGEMDYFALLHASHAEMPSEEEQKTMSSGELFSLKNQIQQTKAVNELTQITCKLMKNVSQYTWGELDRVFLKKNQPNSNSTGK